MPKLLKNLFLPVAVLVFAALLAIIMVDSCDELPRREREAIVPTVASVVLQPGPVAVTIHSRGVVTPRWNIDLVSEVSGRVDWVAPEFVQGGEVMEGQLLPPILERHPGVSHRLAGEAEQQAETAGSLELGFVAVLIMIYAALAVPLRSYGLPVIIMTVIPFGLTGAVLGHLIVGLDVSILSTIGMIGLTGIVVNDSLVLVDHINHRLRDRGEFWKDAVLSGAVRRFRPVVLTSVATFIGLLPIQLETSIQAQFVKPMATSVAFGVLFATFVTLVLVPVLYFVGRDIRALFAGTEAALPAPEQS